MNPRCLAAHSSCALSTHLPCRYLIKYSPVHNVARPAADGQYPAFMITTGGGGPSPGARTTLLAPAAPAALLACPPFPEPHTLIFPPLPPPEDHDDRVVPLHSHKLTATLQHVLAGEAGRQPGPRMCGYHWRPGKTSLLPSTRNLQRHPYRRHSYTHLTPPPRPNLGLRRLPRCAPAQPAADANRGQGGPWRRQAHRKDYRGDIRWGTGGDRVGEGALTTSSCWTRVSCRLHSGCPAGKNLVPGHRLGLLHAAAQTCTARHAALCSCAPCSADMMAFAAACIGAKWAHSS